MKEIVLADISVGLSNGEIESKEPNFVNMFYTGNRKYEELGISHKFLVTGRKGTGKTVLAKYYMLKKHSQANRHSVKYLVLDKYDADEYIELSYLNESAKLQHFFQKYYLVKETCIAVKDTNYKLRDFNFNIFKFKRYKKDLKKLRSHYDDVYGDGVYDAKNMIKRIKETYDDTIQPKVGLSLPGGLPSVELANEIRSTTSREIEKEFKKLNFLERTEALESKVYKCLEHLSIEIILDDFDEIDIKNNEDRYHYIANFIETVKRTNRSLSNFGESRIVLLLREDYLTKLNSIKPNMQKTISDSLIELNWTDSTNKKALIDLVVNKIKNSNQSLSEFSIDDVKNRFFPKYPPGSKTAFENALEHIVDYTFYRPRDLVVYVETIIKNYGDENFITEDMVLNCSAEFSRKFKGEIENELSSHFDFSFQEKIFESLRIQNKQKFKAKHYIKEMTEKNIFKSEEEAEFALNTMFAFSIIGNFKLTNRKNARGERIPRFTFKYREPGAVSPDFNSTFQVHKGLIKSLNIV